MAGDGKAKGKKRKRPAAAGSEAGAAGSASSQQGPPDSVEGSLEEEEEISDSCSAILRRAKKSIGQGGNTSTRNLVLGLLKQRDGDKGKEGGRRVVSPTALTAAPL